MKFFDVLKMALNDKNIEFRNCNHPNVVYKIEYCPHPIIRNKIHGNTALIDGSDIMNTCWEIVPTTLTVSQKRKALIQFMEEKSNRIKETIGLCRYFTDKDAFHIKKWEDEIIENVYDKLDENISTSNVIGLETNTCPFCIKNVSNLCKKCPYSFSHGICNDGGSFIDILYYTCRKNNINIKDIFSTEWYLKTWEKIKRNS